MLGPYGKYFWGNQIEEENRKTKLRWLDCSENDLKLTGVQRLRKKAEDRFEWASILKYALI
jgi:hypothetical protein